MYKKLIRDYTKLIEPNWIAYSNLGLSVLILLSSSKL